MAEPIKILEVLASGAIGGGASHLESLARTVDSERFTLGVATTVPLLQTLSQAGLPVVGLGPGLLQNVGILAGAMRDVQLVHAHGTRATLMAAPGAYFHRIPLVYTVHGWSFHPRRFRTAAVWLEGFLARQCRQVVCVSQDDWFQGLDCGVLQGASSRVIPNGIDLGRFKSDPEARARLRDAAGIAPNAPVIGFCGRLTHQKAPELFMLAAHTVLSRCPDARFLMLGDGPERPRLEGLAQALGLAPRFHFLGEQHDVPAWLAALDCFVLPSRWEGLPIVLLEAMAAGVPVVATAVNGSRELVRHGETGLLVPPDHLAELSAAILSILADPERAHGYAQAAEARVKRSYSLAHMADALQALYLEVSSTHARCLA